MEPLPSFGRYEALFRVASGGMAEVFAARIRGEAGFEKLVAVKRMLPHLAQDPHFVDMFLDEAKLAVHVSSPHVVQTLDLGRAEDGALYIAMELVVGSSLATLIRETRRKNDRVPLPIALEILAQAAQGLDDAHEAVTPTGVQLGIVHRDVSPHNILVGVDGRTRVTDFGIARAMLRRTSTAAGELKGKFAYFSPEQAEGRPVDRRSDVFALGIVAWECFLGRRLFTGDDMLQILNAVKSNDIPLLHELEPDIPFAISRVVARALERNPERRYATAAELAHALRDVAREIGPTPPAREIGRWVRQAGGEALEKVRGMIDAALLGDDLPTRKLEPRGSSASFPSVAPKPDLAPRPLRDAQRLELVSLEPDMATIGAATVPTPTDQTFRSGKRNKVAIAIAVLAISAGSALFWVSQRNEPSTPAAAPPESAPLAIPTPSTTAPPPASTPSSAATTPPPSHPPSKHVVPKHKGAPTHAPTHAPTPAATPAPTPTPTQTAAPAPTQATPAKPKGPTLGDEAFDQLKPK